MAATYTTSQVSVFGDLRVRAGTVHFNDGADEIQFDGMKNVIACQLSAESAASGGMPMVKLNSSAVGYVDVSSVSSGDAFQFIVMGY